jgi:flavodoxin
MYILSIMSNRVNALVIYDSLYGNTEKIAQAVGGAVGGVVKQVNDINGVDFNSIDILIVGSPVHGGRATPEINAFLKKLPAGALKNTKVSAFDTRFAIEEQGVGLRMLMSVIHFAAERIAKDLTKKGGILTLTPEGFIVEEKEGPLKKGEIERAKQWARRIKQG